jgi:HTH-type transcriptional regulator / antitoxin HigA
MLDLLDKLVDTIGDQEEHPLMDLLDMVSCLVREQDDRNIDIPNPKPHEALQFFMDARGTRTPFLQNITTPEAVGATLSPIPLTLTKMTHC